MRTFPALGNTSCHWTIYEFGSMLYSDTLMSDRCSNIFLTTSSNLNISKIAIDLYHNWLPQYQGQIDQTKSSGVHKFQVSNHGYKYESGGNSDCHSFICGYCKHRMTWPRGLEVSIGPRLIPRWAPIFNVCAFSALFLHLITELLQTSNMASSKWPKWSLQNFF